jgi:putative ABC transport system ATP-binding protein
MQQAIVTLEGVYKEYVSGDTVITALKPTTLDISAGQLTLIMGPSGSGKTTLLSIIGCVIYPTDGSVYYEKVPVTKLNQKQLSDLRLEKIGFVFQHFNLIEPLNALENVMQPLILQGVRKSDAAAKSKQALEQVGLGDRLYNLPKKLSGGQKQRVAIARALVTDPAMILCDEPTASLDAKSADRIMEELKSLAKKGKAVLIVTHDLRLRKYADQVIYVEEGEVSDAPKDESSYK